MKIFIINTDYPKFLGNLYGSSPALQRASYVDQIEARNESLFGVADYYSRNFRLHGEEAAEFHVNNPWLQNAWARENGCHARIGLPRQEDFTRGDRHTFVSNVKKLLRPVVRRFAPGSLEYRITPSEKAILFAQVESFRPDIILNQDMGYVRDEELLQIKRPGLNIVGQIAAAVPQREGFTSYDLVISSLPNLVQWFRGRGKEAQLSRLAFEPSILPYLSPVPEKDAEVSFVGSLSPEHGGRIALLEQIASSFDLKIWGNGIERLPATSPLHHCYVGEAWGREMYKALQRSSVTINHHIDLAGRYANNMRLYEATGVGTAMVVDHKQNLSDMFVAGKEVVTYRSAEECCTLINTLLQDQSYLSSVANSGQKRTVNDHNYYNRTAEIIEMIGRLQ